MRTKGYALINEQGHFIKYEVIGDLIAYNAMLVSLRQLPRPLKAAAFEVVDTETGLLICKAKTKKLCLSMYETMYQDKHQLIIDDGYKNHQRYIHLMETLEAVKL